MELDAKNSEIKECCKDSNNLKQEESGKSDLTMYRCVVCKCRHFELTVDPEHFGLVGSSL